jgi:uncharacterized delta-60 repeat protein
MLSIIKSGICGRLSQPAAKTLGFATAIAALFAMSSGLGRAQAAGTLDLTFGTGGTVTTIFNGQTITPVGAVEQPNGDIVVLCEAGPSEFSLTQLALTRYTSAGALDTTFGTKGTTLTAFSAFTFTPFAFALEPNGEFLVAGSVVPGGGAAEFGLAQFSASGALDTTFGTAGVAAAEVIKQTDSPSALLLQPNGQIVIAGFQPGDSAHPSSSATPTGGTSIVRFNSDGALDTTFGTSGAALVSAGMLSPTAVALLSNGDYLIVGQSTSGTGPAEAEVSSTGVLQSSITTATVTATSPLQGLEQMPTAFESNGDIVVSNEGATSHDATLFPIVSLLSEAGVKDTGFAATKISFGGKAKGVGQAIAVQSNGQVVVGGIINDASPIAGGLARLDTNGDLDTTFGDAGTVTFDNSVSALLIEANGDIVAVEAPGADGGDGIVLQRYLAN